MAAVLLFSGSVVEYGKAKEIRMKNLSFLQQWIFRKELLTPPQKAFAGGSLWVGLGAAIMLFDEFLVFFVPFFCLELGIGTLAARFLSSPRTARVCGWVCAGLAGLLALLARALAGPAR